MVRQQWVRGWPIIIWGQQKLNKKYKKNGHLCHLMKYTWMVLYREVDIDPSISNLHGSAHYSALCTWISQMIILQNIRLTFRLLYTFSCQLWYKSMMEHYRFDFAHGALLRSLQLQWLQSIHQRHKPLSTLSCTFLLQGNSNLYYLHPMPIPAFFCSICLKWNILHSKQLPAFYVIVALNCTNTSNIQRAQKAVK